MKLSIDPILKALYGGHDYEEYADLQELIVSEGKIHDAIHIWTRCGDQVFDPPKIVDGMRRYIIAQDLGYSIRTVEHEFDGYEDALLWMKHWQGDRRNNTKEDRENAHIALYAELSQESYRGPKREGDEAQTTAERVAKMTGSSPRTVSRDVAKGKKAEKAKGDLHGSVVKAIEEDKLKVSRDDTIKLAKYSKPDQQKLVGQVRRGKYDSLADAMKVWAPDHPKKLGSTKLTKMAETLEKMRCDLDKVVGDGGDHRYYQSSLDDLNKVLINLKTWSREWDRQADEELRKEYADTPTIPE